MSAYAYVFFGVELSEESVADIRNRAIGDVLVCPQYESVGSGEFCSKDGHKKVKRGKSLHPDVLYGEGEGSDYHCAILPLSSESDERFFLLIKKSEQEVDADNEWAARSLSLNGFMVKPETEWIPHLLSFAARLGVLVDGKKAEWHLVAHYSH